MTYELYDEWIAAKDDPVGLKSVVSHLPFVNRFVLCEIMSLLSFLEKEKESTKMNASNLAIVMTPNLLYQKGVAKFSSEPQEVVMSLIINYSTIFKETEAFRERQRSERVSAKHRLRSLRTSKALSAQGCIKERRVSPVAMAFKAEYNLAAPQSIIRPPPVDDIPPPPTIQSPIASPVDIGPPQEAPPPLMAPASPARASTSPTNPSSPMTSSVMPGFSQSLIPPPPGLNPILPDEIIPPPPLVDEQPPPEEGQKKLADLGRSESGSSSLRKHSRHKSSGNGSALLLRDSAEGEKKKKKKHKDKDKNQSSGRLVRDRGDSVAAVSDAKSEDNEAEGTRARAVSEWSDTRSEKERKKGKRKSMSARATTPTAPDSVSQTSADMSETPPPSSTPEVDGSSCTASESASSVAVVPEQKSPNELNATIEEPAKSEQ